MLTNMAEAFRSKGAVIFNRLLDLSASLSIVLLVFAWLGVSFEIVLRYFGSELLLSAGEVTEYCLVFITFLGMAWLLREEGHVSIDLVVDHVSPRAKTLLNVITSILSAALFLMMAWVGTTVTIDHFRRGITTATLLNIPKAPLLVVIPLGSVMLFIQFLRRTRRYLKAGERAPEEKIDAV